MRKRVLAIVVVICMVSSLFPMISAASDSDNLTTVKTIKVMAQERTSLDTLVKLCKEAVVISYEGSIEEYKSEIEAFTTSIDKKINKLENKLENGCNTTEYKNVVNQINSVKRQIGALSGDNSSSARAKRKKLEAQLAELEAEKKSLYDAQSINAQILALEAEKEVYVNGRNRKMEWYEKKLNDNEHLLSTAYEWIDELSEKDLIEKCKNVVIKTPITLNQINITEDNLEEIYKAGIYVKDEYGLTTKECMEYLSYKIDFHESDGHIEEIMPAKPATCTESGLTEGKRCCVCEKILIEQEGIVEKGHSWNDNYTVDKAASTKAAGSKSKHCATCDAVDEASVVKIAKIKKTTAADQVYNGKNKTQNVTVVNFNGKKLVKGKDFTVTYKKVKGNKVVTPKAIGEYKAIVKFKGDYSGSVTKTFNINPQGTNLKKVTKGKKQFTATWNKKTVQVTGYQIRYSTKQNMNGAQTKLVTKAKTTKTTIKNLKANKKYWVQIRTYKTVNGVKYYSAWSSYKVVTTK